MTSRRSKIFYIMILGLLFLPSLASAGFLDDVACIKNPGGCDSVDNVAQAITAFIKYSLGIIGAVALLFFIWGGVQWLISGGNSSRIERGKQIMINTAMGIVVAFGSYLILSFFVNDILLGKNQITSCVNKSQGAVCNEKEGNYICTGVLSGEVAQYSESCVTECQLKDIQDVNNTWSCGSFSQLSLSRMVGSIFVPPVEGQDFVKNLCPGGEDNVCINSKAYY